MKNYFNICTIYILLWCVYYLQGIVYTSGGMISQLVLLLVLVISGYYFVKVNVSYATISFIKVLNVFIVIMTIYGLIYMMDPTQLYFHFYIDYKVEKLEFLKSLYISLLPIYAIYGFTKEGLLKTEVIHFVTILLLILTTLLYFHAENEALQKALEIGLIREEFTNNIAYKFIHIFPLLFFWQKRPFIQYLFLGYIFTFVVMGMKRGAIVIGAICLLWFLYRIWTSASFHNKSKIVALTILIIIISSGLLIDFYNNSEYFQYRIDQTLEGDSSGRDSIYSILWDYFINQSSIFNILLGNGAAQTVMIAGNYAHNDWLELLICQGLLGVSIYSLYYASLFSNFIQSKNNLLIYNILGMCLLIMFLSSLFSMSYSNLNLGITVCLGYCFANANKTY